MIGKILRETLQFTLFGAMLTSAVLPTQAAPKTLMLFGDSLMAGYGLPDQDAFAAQLKKSLEADGYEVKIVNASVSGDTSAAALARIDWSLSERPDAVLLGLGGNDMLRGLSPAQMSENLRAILVRLQEQQIPVLLLGMRASPSLGEDYVEEFDHAFPTLAAEFGVPLYPFFLEGVALDSTLNQPDGIHPNARGVQTMVRGVLPMIKQLLDE
ncbi:arylesterase [Devosia submarina]|uniref:arylesterase n=1 Tax=Devosia submarina TaxID=1173082 RepID=UPI001FE8A0F1|nr:arylesterase [Devosia submarina]